MALAKPCVYRQDTQRRPILHSRAMVEDLYAWCFKVFVRYGAGRAGTWCYGMLTLPIWNKKFV